MSWWCVRTLARVGWRGYRAKCLVGTCCNCTPISVNNRVNRRTNTHAGGRKLWKTVLLWILLAYSIWMTCCCKYSEGHIGIHHLLLPPCIDENRRVHGWKFDLWWPFAVQNEVVVELENRHAKQTWRQKIRFALLTVQSAKKIGQWAIEKVLSVLWKHCGELKWYTWEIFLIMLPTCLYDSKELSNFIH